MATSKKGEQKQAVGHVCKPMEVCPASLNRNSGIYLRLLVSKKLSPFKSVTSKATFPSRYVQT